MTTSIGKPYNLCVAQWSNSHIANTDLTLEGYIVFIIDYAARLRKTCSVGIYYGLQWRWTYNTYTHYILFDSSFSLIFRRASNLRIRQQRWRVTSNWNEEFALVSSCISNRWQTTSLLLNVLTIMPKIFDFPITCNSL